jgi:hypothetical protein
VPRWKLPTATIDECYAAAAKEPYMEAYDPKDKPARR